MQDRINKLEDAKDKKMKEAKSLKYVKGKQTSVAKNTLNHLYEGEEYEMIYDPSIMKGDGNVTLEVWDYDKVGLDDLIGSVNVEILPALQHEIDFELYLQPKPDKKKDQSKLKSNLAQYKPDKNNGIIKFTMIYLPEEKQQEKDKENENELKRRQKPKQKDYESDSNSEDEDNKPKQQDKEKEKVRKRQPQQQKDQSDEDEDQYNKPKDKDKDKDNQLKQRKKPKQKDYDSDSNSEDKSGDNESSDESDPDSKNKSKKDPKKMKYDENDSKYIKGVVKIRNVKVRDLPEMDFMDKFDPYVVFKLGADESKQTSVAHNTQNYDYIGEQFELLYIPNKMKERKEIDIEVWDYDRIGSNDLIGAGIVEILPIFEHEIYNEVFIYKKKDTEGYNHSQSKLSLKQRQEQEKNCGKVCFSLMYISEEKYIQDKIDEENKKKQKEQEQNLRELYQNPKDDDEKKKKDMKRKKKDDKQKDFDYFDPLKVQGRELDESEYVIGVVRVKVLDLNNLAQNEPKRKPNPFTRLIIGAEEKETKTYNKAIDVDFDELFDIDFDPEKTNERELFIEVLDRKKKKYDKEEYEEYESDEDDYDYEDEFGRYFLNPQKLHLNLIGDQDEGQNEAAGDMYIEIVYLPQQDYNKMIDKEKQKQLEQEKEKPKSRNPNQSVKSPDQDENQDEDDEYQDPNKKSKSLRPPKGRYSPDEDEDDEYQDPNQKQRRSKPKQKDYPSDEEDDEYKDPKDKQKEKERKKNQIPDQNKPDQNKPDKDKEKAKKDFENKLKNKPPQPPQGQRTIKALREAARLKIPSPEAIAAHELSDLIPFDVGGKSDAYVVLNLGGQEFRTEVANKTLHPVYNRQYKFDFDPKKTKDREVKFEVWDQDRILWDEPVKEFQSNLEKPEEQLREIEEDGADEFLHLGDVLFGILYTTSEDDVDLPALLDKKKQQEKENKKKQKQKKKQDKLKPDEDQDDQYQDPIKKSKSIRPSKGRYSPDEDEDDQYQDPNKKQRKPKQKDYPSDEEDDECKDPKDKQKEKERKKNQIPDKNKPDQEKEKAKKDFENKLKNKPPQPPQGQRTIKALREAARLKIPSPEAIAAHVKEQELSDLIPFDVGGKSDPYVVLNLGGQEFRTEVAHKTLHPVYNRQYKFDFDPKKTKDREVKFEVWDQDKILWDEPIGEMFVPFLSNLENPEEQLREIEEDGADEFLHLGDVLFGILYTTSEDDVDLPALLDKKKQQDKENKKKQKQKKKQDKLKPDEDEREELNLDLDSVDSYQDNDHPYDQDEDAN
ncbi:MAG: hypothetical protein EZS28_001557 [Streblomastix strix]|uniref:C2 domain-containing protein n=1 Tax=Streblomastix strix TaxID=222440 RepID=A0A5J4X832_9EUKA|nr:MAG: hypothetical protein EZS28_001557 [Streblomastix strix]